MEDLELLWNGLLSRRPELILAAWQTLSRKEQHAVYAHLIRMTTEEGWTEPQRISAEAALVVLDAQEDHHTDRTAPRDGP